MNHELVIRPEAEVDLMEIFTWYEGKRQGLGREFLNQVETSLRFIQENPFVSFDLYKGVRRYLLRRFPYKIFYYVNAQRIIVLAIIHGGRDPEFIRKRLRTN
jgi:plasmid stabilization system protein ParE